jgi:RNA polymerase-binding protein DksA
MFETAETRRWLMNPKTQAALERRLRAERARLWEEATAADSQLQALSEVRESELEEVAQQERDARLMARLDLRAKREIEEIDAALARLAEGRYGECIRCGKAIAVARLRALPATRLCIRCAQVGPAAPASEEEAPEHRTGVVPADRALLSDRELESELRELLNADGRIDMHELRVVCRHGVVYLNGVLPSAAEHDITLRLVTDFVGLPEVVDRIAVNEILWERSERSRPEAEVAAAPRYEPSETEDIVKSTEEGIEYVPPNEPPPEPEE